MRVLYFTNGDLPNCLQDQRQGMPPKSSVLMPPAPLARLELDWSGRTASLLMTENQKVVRRWVLEPLPSIPTSSSSSAASSSSCFSSCSQLYTACMALPAARRRRLICCVSEDGTPVSDATPSEKDEWYLLQPGTPCVGDVCATPKVVSTAPFLFQDSPEKLDLIAGVNLRNKKYSQQEVHLKDYGRVYKTISRGIRSDILNAETHMERARMRKEAQREKLIEEVENGTSMKESPKSMMTMLEGVQGSGTE